MGADYMKISPYIFPILGEPDTVLMRVINHTIAMNGGRVRLIEKIENEWAKSYSFRKKHITDGGKAYTIKEVMFIKDNYFALTSFEIAVSLDRPITGIREKINKMQVAGDLIYKQKH